MLYDMSISNTACPICNIAVPRKKKLNDGSLTTINTFMAKFKIRFTIWKPHILDDCMPHESMQNTTIITKEQGNVYQR